MVTSVKTFFAAATLLALPLAALATDPQPEVINARALGLGGAVTSVVDHAMSVRANPAALAVERGFFGGATYLNRDKNQLDSVSVALVDNQSAPIAGAVQYLRVVTDQEVEEVGLSFAGGDTTYYWGGTLRFVHARQDRDDDWDNAMVGDLGLLLVRQWGLNIGIVGRDLFDPSFRALERRVAVGASMPFYDAFMVSVDFVRYFDHGYSDGTSTHAGLEWHPQQTPWTLRAGYSTDGVTDADSYSLGLGWSNQRITIDYGFQQNRRVTGELVHAISLSGPF